MSKRLKKPIDTMYPNTAKKTRCNKRDRSVTVDWVLVARVVAVSKEAPVTVEWNLAACVVHGIGSETARSKFAETAGSSASAAPITWAG